jgi:hypothetical protein
MGRGGLLQTVLRLAQLADRSGQPCERSDQCQAGDGTAAPVRCAGGQQVRGGAQRGPARRRRRDASPERAASPPEAVGGLLQLGAADGLGSIAGRLSDEVSWLRQCADSLALLDADSRPPAVNLHPSAGWPDRAVVAAGLARVAAVIGRIAADVDELARARRAQDLNTAAVLPDPRAERRRRLAEPDLEFRAFCTTRRRLPASSAPQLARAWDAWQAERYQHGEISYRPGYTGNPFRPR